LCSLLLTAAVLTPLPPPLPLSLSFPPAVLCENGRLNELPAVITDFATLMRAHRKEIEVTITSAESLDSEDLGSIKDALGNLKKSVSPLCPYQHLPRTRTRPQSQGVCLGSSSHGISACIWGRIA